MYDENNQWTPIHFYVFNGIIGNNKEKKYKGKINCVKLLLSIKSKTMFDIRQKR